MAGSLTIGVQPVHIYQRRFDSQDLAVALRNSHLYLISRRPRVRLDGETATWNRSGVKVVAFGRHEGRESVWSEEIHLYPPEGGSIEDFRVHADGSYFSLRVAGRAIHGDAWALASFHSNAAEHIAGQEVVYAGKAYGRDGSSNAWERTQKHVKLQRIYEDHLADGWDVFLSPLEVEYMKMGSDDHIDDSDDGPDLMGGYYGVYMDLPNRILAPTIDLAEHGLISYFVPHYNENLLEWCAAEPTKDMRLMRSGGFRLLQIHFNGWNGLSRFYSRQEPARVRSHLISHDLPPRPDKTIRRGIGVKDLTSWRAKASLVPHGHNIFAQHAEQAGVILRAFGDAAPEVRRPPEVVF
ncbi:hypothetical protein ACN261_01025 [Micromonospora sp. WMMD723]|uniref:hypothetical protein n=1 Tax=Micromonospora sp. WMMD723 TaxID=3403465 RepID=UPI003CF143C4